MSAADPPALGFARPTWGRKAGKSLGQT